MQHEQVAVFLESSPLFAIFDDPARLKIAERANERSFSKTTLIFSVGDPGSAFYVIEGTVKVFVTSRIG